MKIIKTGSIPKEKHYKYKFICKYCLTIFEVDETELKTEVRQVYDGELVEQIEKKYVDCPLCDRRVYKSIFTKKIKCEENEKNGKC